MFEQKLANRKYYYKFSIVANLHLYIYAAFFFCTENWNPERTLIECQERLNHNFPLTRFASLSRKSGRTHTAKTTEMIFTRGIVPTRRTIAVVIICKKKGK